MSANVSNTVIPFQNAQSLFSPNSFVYTVCFNFSSFSSTQYFPGFHQSLTWVGCSVSALRSWTSKCLAHQRWLTEVCSALQITSFNSGQAAMLIVSSDVEFSCWWSSFCRLPSDARSGQLGQQVSRQQSPTCLRLTLSVGTTRRTLTWLDSRLTCC